MASDKIKRNIIWLRKTLGIIDKTTLPGEILGEVRPTMDTFGWDRLDDLQNERVNVAAPGQVAASTVVPPGIVRYIHAASITHTDTGVTHEASLVKRRQPNTFNVGVPTDRRLITDLMFCSMQGRTFIREGDFLIGQVVTAPVAGQLTLTFYFVDIDPGEYINAM